MKKRFLIISLVIGLFWVLSGGAAMAQLSANPVSKDFGGAVIDVDTISEKFTIKNNGTANITISSVYLTGDNPYQFSIENDACSGVTIAAGETCVVDVAFSPTLTGVKNAFLRIDSNDTPLEIDLVGTGVISGDIESHTSRVKIQPSGDVDIPTLHIIELQKNAPYKREDGTDYPDAIPLLVEGGNNLNTVAVITDFHCTK